MEIATLVDTYVSTGQKIDVLWNFFVTVHLAIAGLFFLAREKLKIHIASVLIMFMGYFFFSLINFGAKEIEYGLLNAITKELKDVDTAYEYLNVYFDQLDFADRSLRNVLIHIGSGLSIIIVGLFSGFTVTFRRKEMYES